MKHSSLLVFLAANVLAGGAVAGAMGPIEQKNWTWVGTLSAGAGWAKGDETQSFYLTPTIQKTYVANQDTTTLFAGEVFAGVQTRLSQILQGQLGLAVGVTSNAKLSGVIWDDTDPQASNFIYSYKVQHTQIAVKGKLLADAGYWVMPWVSGTIGVGLGINSAHSYTSTPLAFEYVATPNFSSHTQASLSYSVDAGVQKALNPHWQAGVGYEFSDWGNSRLGSAADQTANSGLVLHHLYSNNLIFNLTYLA